VTLRIRIHPVGAALLLALAHVVCTVSIAFHNFMQIEESGPASVSSTSRLVEQMLAFPLLRALPPETFMSRPGGGGMLFAALAVDGVLWGGVLVAATELVRRMTRPTRHRTG
jgi:hypothetical protein